MIATLTVLAPAEAAPQYREPVCVAPRSPSSLSSSLFIVHSKMVGGLWVEAADEVQPR
jgi:hypothetical protein